MTEAGTQHSAKRQQKVFLVRNRTSVERADLSGSLVVPIAHGKLLDFRAFSDLGAVARLLVDDLRERVSVVSATTLSQSASSVRAFLSFAMERAAAGLPVELNRETVLRWADNLEASSVSLSSKYHHYSRLTGMLGRLMGDGRIERFSYPALFRNSLAFSEPIPTLGDLLPVRQDVERPTEADLLGRVLSHAWMEIESAWARFEFGRSFLASGTADPDTYHYKDIRFLLSYVMRHCGGHVLSIAEVRAKGLPDAGKYKHGLEIHGGVLPVSTYLYATAKTLIPFHIIFAAAGINAESIPGITIHDLKETDDPAWRTLDWNKLRAGGELHGLQFPIGGRNARTVPRAFEKLVALTDPIRNSGRIPQEFRDYLALVRIGQRGSDERPLRYVGETQVRALDMFIEDFVSVNPDLRGLRFGLSNIRTTAINACHMANGRNLSLTAIMARHKKASRAL